LSRYSNTVESVDLRKCPYHRRDNNKNFSELAPSHRGGKTAGTGRWHEEIRPLSRTLRIAEELTAIGHDGSVDGVVTARVPVSHRLVEHHFHHSLARHRRPVRIVLVQVYMWYLYRCTTCTCVRLVPEQVNRLYLYMCSAIAPVQVYGLYLYR